MTEQSKKKWTFKVRSIQSLFFSAMVLLIATLSLPILIAGVGIMNSLIEDFGTEILNEQLQSLIAPVDLRYQTLARVGLEDSLTHLQEIEEEALVDFALYRYKASGRVFVVGKDKQILLGADFFDENSPEFNDFYEQLTGDKVQITYGVNGHKRFAAASYYGPWQSYIGISMDREELFAPRNFFVRFNLLVLAGVIAVAILLVGALSFYLVTPLIKLTRFADKVSQGEEASLSGRYIFELADMRDDMLRMVETLKSREEKYRAVFDAPSDAIFIHNAEDGRVLETNKTVYEMFGYESHELTGKTVADISAGFHPYTADDAGEVIRAAFVEGPQRLEWLSRKKDGTLFWTDVSVQRVQFGDTQYVLAVARDIDEQKRFADELASEREQLATTLHSIADGVITSDNDGNVALVNNVAEQITGWTQEDAQGKPLSDVFHLTYVDVGSENISSEEIDNRLSGFRQTTLVARDGTRRLIDHSSAPIYNPENEVVGVVLVFRDITEQQRLEEELHKVKKLESVGVLAGGIAHDFNNILAAILGNMNLARMQVEAGSKVDRLLDQAEKASLRAQSLTRQLLTFSKGGEPVFEPANIYDIVTENASFVLHGSPVRCEFNFAKDLMRVTIDPGQIGQVIQNIILNARQAMADKGGVIHVTAENCHSCSVQGNPATIGCIKVIIKDDGPGMTPEVVDKIFDPYFSTKEEGSGLGLAISHSIIQKHGGVLAVESELGKGTTFTIKLPVHHKHIPEIDGFAKAEKEVRPSRILIMDDEAMIRDMASHMLGHLGHEVATAADGDQAVQFYRQAQEDNNPFDMAIMDLTIPGGKGGLEAAGEILTLDPDAKLVVASGYSNDPIMAHYQEHGFTAMLTKPFMVADLENILAATLPAREKE